MNHDKLLKDARKIESIISNTDIDYRGVLLSHVATLLQNHSQNYTAGLIYRAAVEYGLPSNGGDGIKEVK